MSPQREGGTDTRSSNSSDPWTPNAITEQSKPSVSKSVGDMKEGATKLADGATSLIIALFVILFSLLSEEDIELFEEKEEAPINADDPFWSVPPIPESEWDEDTESVSANTDAYLYGRSTSE